MMEEKKDRGLNDREWRLRERAEGGKVGEKKKLWRPLVWFVLTTLKNRWTLFLIVVIILIRTFSTFLSFRDYFRSYSFFPVSSRQWYAAPITEEKMSHHGQFSYYLYTYVCVYIHMSVHWHNALDQKCFSCSFPFLCQSRRVTLGERDENRETSERKRRERDLPLEK